MKHSEAKSKEIAERKLARRKAKSALESAAGNATHQKKKEKAKKAKLQHEQDVANPWFPVDQQIAVHRKMRARSMGHNGAQRMAMRPKPSEAPKDDALMNVASESVLQKAKDEGIDLDKLESN